MPEHHSSVQFSSVLLTTVLPLYHCNTLDHAEVNSDPHNYTNTVF